MERDFVEFTSANAQIDAPADTVWDVLTARTGDIFMGATFTTDWVVGHPLTFEGSWEGQAYCDHGEVVFFDNSKRLSFTQFSSMSGKSDLPENYDLVAFELAPSALSIKVFLCLGKPQGVAAPTGAEEMLTKNLDVILAKLKELSEAA